MANQPHPKLKVAQELGTIVQQKAKQGDYPGAIALLNHLLQNNPHNAWGYHNRGLMHLRCRQFRLALADFDRALKINPRFDRAYNNRANCYLSLGNWAAALQDYESALDFNSSNILAWINQGITFRKLGLYDLALENFDMALVLAKQKLQGRLYAERGRTYHLRGDWNCAIADYRRSLSHHESNSIYHNYQKTVREWLLQLQTPRTR